MTRRIAGFLLGLLCLAGVAPAHAAGRGGWDCSYEGNGDDPARYVNRLEQRGDTLVEPHWPRSLTYRILIDTSDVLVAVHAYAEPPAFRRDALGGATVIVINKVSGRMRRSSGTSRDDADQILFGRCNRY